MVVLEGAKDYILALLAREKTGISHIGIGTGTPTSNGLGNEVGRRSIRDVVVPATKQRIFEAFFEDTYPATDYTIREVGLIGNAGSEYVAATSIASVVKRSGIDSLMIKYKLYYE